MVKDFVISHSSGQIQWPSHFYTGPMEPCPRCGERVQAVGYTPWVSDDDDYFFTQNYSVRRFPDGMIHSWEVYPCMHKISTSLYSIRFEFAPNTVGRWIPELAMREEESKKMHSSFEKNCTTCGGTGKEPSDALRAALEAARLRKPVAGTAVQTIQLEDIIKTALAEYLRVVEQEAEEARRANRRTWKVGDPEPGPEVTAVRDRFGDIQRRDGRVWRDPDSNERNCWAYIARNYGPLEDWTHGVA